MKVTEIKNTMTAGTWVADPSTYLPLAIIDNTEDGNGIAELGEMCSENNANLEAIISAVNNTWQAGFNPESVHELVDGLNYIIAWGNKAPDNELWNEMRNKAKKAVRKAIL